MKQKEKEMIERNKKHDEYHNDHSKAMEVLYGIHLRLKRISSSFYNIGNEILGEKLNIMAEDIYNAHDVAILSVGGMINIEFKRSQDVSDTILKTALAGCLIGSENKK